MLLPLVARNRSVQIKRDSHRHDDRRWYVVQQRRRVLPLPHGVDRGLVEQRNRAEDFYVLHFAVSADGRFENHDPLNARRLRDLWVHGLHLLQLSRCLDLTADANWLRGWWRWWRGRGRIRQAADNAAGNTSRNAAFDADRFVEVGVLRNLGLDFLGSLDRRRVRVDLHRSRRAGLGRWRWWRGRRRRWRRGRNECEHRGRRREYVRRHQRNNDDETDHQHFKSKGQGHRIALLVPELDGRIHDVAEHAFFAWHRVLPPAAFRPAGRAADYS